MKAINWKKFIKRTDSANIRKAHILSWVALFAFFLIFFIRCTNIYTRLVEPEIINPAEVTSTEKITETDTAALMENGDALLSAGSYSAAYFYYARIIELEPKNSLARLAATRALLLRDELAVIALMGKLTQAANPFTGLASILNSTALYTSDSSSLFLVRPILDMPGGKSLINGECDGVVSPNSMGVNLNLMLVTGLAFPGKVFDSSGDKLYNDTRPIIAGGDLIIVTNNTVAPNLDQAGMTAALTAAASNLVTSSAILLTNPAYNYTNSITASDTSLKTFHSLIEAFVNALKTFDVYGEIDFLAGCAVRLSAIDPTGLVSSYAVSATNLMHQYLGTVKKHIDGSYMNQVHYNLAGHDAFPTDLYSYPSGGTAWLNLYTETAAHTRSAQERLKIVLTNYYVLTNKSGLDYLNYYSNILAPSVLFYLTNLNIFPAL